MIIHILEQLNKLSIILATQSPRRIQLLQNLGLKFRSIASKFAEDLDKSKFSIDQYVIATSKHKAIHIANTFPDSDIIISADTVVVCENEILEKPSSLEDAHRMLTKLSGRKHQVFTGCTILHKPFGQCSEQLFHFDCFHEVTEVEFAPLSDQVIRAYIATNEPMDKAGGYGIQGSAGTFVKAIHGCYFNVMGFPVHTMSTHLAHIYETRVSNALGVSSGNGSGNNSQSGSRRPSLAAIGKMFSNPNLDHGLTEDD